jgi:hypothetical protein
MDEEVKPWEQNQITVWGQPKETKSEKKWIDIGIAYTNKRGSVTVFVSITCLGPSSF